MGVDELFGIFQAEFGDDWPNILVPPREDVVWNITGTIPADPKAAFIDDLTVTPSIDASKSGHWHGHIKNGNVE